MKKALEVAPDKVLPVSAPKTAGFELINPKSFKEAMEMAEFVSKSGLVPETYRNKPADIIVAWQMGSEVGLPPMVALRFICVIKGRPSIWGQGATGLMISSPHIEWIKESNNEEIKKTGIAWVEIKRVGWAPIKKTFSKAEADRAGLTRKDTYKGYLEDMLLWRARSRAYDATGSDILNGLTLVEVARTLEPLDVTPTPKIEPADAEAKPQDGTGNWAKNDDPEPETKEGTVVEAEVEEEEEELNIDDGMIRGSFMLEKVSALKGTNPKVFTFYTKEGVNFYTDNEDIARKWNGAKEDGAPFAKIDAETDTIEKKLKGGTVLFHKILTLEL